MSEYISKVAVFCGARGGVAPVYIHAAAALGLEVARRGLTLVYGGGRTGLMGAVADAALSAGGHVIGVMPEFLVEREVAHQGLTEMVVVPSMHARKALMAERADAFVALPGGLGTLEEFFETLTWTQLDLQRKAHGLLNTEGYFDQLLRFLQRGYQDEMIGSAPETYITVRDEAAVLLDVLQSLSPTGGLLTDRT
ncbi:TIGR00730 family Rossman fold protein (plasmid) [Deinococcus taeanensis]|uniref:LOG family protein n=1 Tax=Deinococcus taeanensis TaxID=2737050 RepID=UPI001CDD7D03|nr:TIGR00730 family Rossman fold protein [Deinococcus taeanensis]UBV45383.1 TIGR00730 family Rossman fold protein [Deinococcus taeanensis]